MPLIDRQSTSATQAASRANGRHSAGPTTPDGKCRSSLNALKHGCYSESLLDTMLPLGEDPEEFVELRQGLLDAHQPANPAEALLVDDLALLRWRKIRNERGQAGVLGRSLERLELEHQRRLKELHHELTSAPQAEILQHGFYQQPDSPGKYEQIASLLDSLLEQVRHCHFALDADPVLTMLWGQEPSLRGMYFTNAFRGLRRLTADLPDGGREERYPMEEEPQPESPEGSAGPSLESDPSPGAGHPTDSGSPEPDVGPHPSTGSEPAFGGGGAEDRQDVDGPDSSGRGPTPGAPPPPEAGPPGQADPSRPGATARMREAFRYRLSDSKLEYQRLDLMKDLLDERQKVSDAYQHFLQQYVVVTAAQRNACFAPNEDEWRALRLQEAALDRQTERKTRLLIDLKREARRAEKWEWKREERQAAQERQARGADGPVHGSGGGPVNGSGQVKRKPDGAERPNGRGSPPEPSSVADSVAHPVDHAVAEPAIGPESSAPAGEPEAPKENTAFSKKRTRHVDENTGSGFGEGSDASPAGAAPEGRKGPPSERLNGLGNGFRELGR